jgi:hypothetical protein
MVKTGKIVCTCTHIPSFALENLVASTFLRCVSCWEAVAMWTLIYILERMLIINNRIFLSFIAHRSTSSPTYRFSLLIYAARCFNIRLERAISRNPKGGNGSRVWKYARYPCIEDSAVDQCSRNAYSFVALQSVELDQWFRLSLSRCGSSWISARDRCNWHVSSLHDGHRNRYLNACKQPFLPQLLPNQSLDWLSRIW